MLAYDEKRFLKRLIFKVLIGYVLIGISIFFIYSCDLDFVVRDRYLPKTDAEYEDGIVLTETPEQALSYAKELNLTMKAAIQVTGTLLGANQELIRTSCPYAKELVGLYNQHFSAVVLSVQGTQAIVAITTKKRLIRQLLEKLSDDEQFLRSHVLRKMTLIGSDLELKGFPPMNVKHIVADKIILDGKVYE